MKCNSLLKLLWVFALCLVANFYSGAQGNSISRGKGELKITFEGLENDSILDILEILVGYPTLFDEATDYQTLEPDITKGITVDIPLYSENLLDELN